MTIRKRKNGQPDRDPLPGHSDPGHGELPTGPTGRQIVVLRPGMKAETLGSLHQLAGLKVASSSDFKDAAITGDDLGGAQGVLLDHLDIAIVEGDNDQVDALAMSVADVDSPILSVEPEVYVVPFQDDEDDHAGTPLVSAAGRDYLAGYADAVHALVGRLVGDGVDRDSGYALNPDADAATTYVDTAQLTWGLQAIRTTATGWSGSGIRIAVLDTGFDLNHPDFSGRSIVTRSFVPGESAQDVHGHGTHCIGTACGPKNPAGTARRYGVAYGATILVGKVLSNSGSGQSGWILAGMNWAIQNHAAVISMSLGSKVEKGQAHSPAYEQAALAALNAGCLVVAAAGNDGDKPVGSPANCPSVMAVAALDQNLQRAPFSCIGINPNGGEVDVAAPGVNVYSSIPMPARYGYKSGTSMATPHVAGIAAQWAQGTGLRGRALWQKLVATARNVGQAPLYVGVGLAQSPVVLRLRPPPPPVAWPIPPIARPVPPIFTRPIPRPQPLDDLESVD